jgi:hypothetical protein
MKIINKEYVDKITKDYNDGKLISRRKNIFYNNMEYTLNSNVYYCYNNEELMEYAKCYNDIVYFIETYLKIKLRKYQIEWIKLYQENKFVIYNTARQTGYNTILTAINLHDMVFKMKSIVLYSTKFNSGIEFLDIIKMYYLKLPYFLKPGIKSFNKKSIAFTTNSKIKISNINNIEKDYNNYQFIDFAFYDKNVKDIIPLISKINKEKQINKLIIQSTPNGKNYFYELYKNSILPESHPDKNIFKSIQTYWYEVEGRDEKWKEEEIKRLCSVEKFNQEYNLEFK